MSVSVVEITNWRSMAACAAADPELFFPSPGASPAKVQEAKAVCAGCPVRQKCLDEAFRTDERDAICGGLTPEERDDFLRGDLTRFQTYRADGMTARQLAMEHGADILSWLVERDMSVDAVAGGLRVTRRAVYLAFRMLVPAARTRPGQPSPVERVLAESSLELRALAQAGHTHVVISKKLKTSQNVVSACLRVLVQRDDALGRVSAGGVAEALRRIQGVEDRVRQQADVSLTVQDVIDMAGDEICTLHADRMPLRHIALRLGFSRETVRRAYQQLTQPVESKALSQDEMRSAA